MRGKKFVCNLLELEALISLFPWHDLMICLFLRLCFQQIIAYLSSAYCPRSGFKTAPRARKGQHLGRTRPEFPLFLHHLPLCHENTQILKRIVIFWIIINDFEGGRTLNLQECWCQSFLLLFLDQLLLVLISCHTPLPSVHRLICYHLLTNETHIITPNVVVLINTNALLFIDCCKLFPPPHYRRSVVNGAHWY